MIPIDDPTDPRVADYVGMRDPELRRATEARDGIFLAEGLNVLRRLVTSRYPIRSVLLSRSQYERLAAELSAALPAATPVYVAGPDVLAAIAGFDLHRGVVASAERGPGIDLDELLARGGPLVGLEALTDHENLGAIARSARALGAKGLLLDDRCADPLYRRAVRVSMGEMLHLPWCRVGSMVAAIDDVRRAGWTVGALTPAAGSVSAHDWSPDPTRTLLLFGSEGPGLTAATIAAADVAVRIPIDASVDSLNVGHAVAVCLALIGRPRAIPPPTR